MITPLRNFPAPTGANPMKFRSMGDDDAAMPDPWPMFETGVTVFPVWTPWHTCQGKVVDDATLWALGSGPDRQGRL
jgi:hypothetical protein